MSGYSDIIATFLVVAIMVLCFACGVIVGRNQ